MQKGEHEKNSQEIEVIELPFGFLEELLSWDEPMEGRREILDAFLEEKNLSLYGQRILFAREQRNLTRKQVSKLSGISEATLKKYETGNYFGKSRGSNILSLSSALGVSCDYISGRSFTLVGSIVARYPSLITHFSEIDNFKHNTVSA